MLQWIVHSNTGTENWACLIEWEVLRELDNEMLVETLLPNMIKTATEIAKKQRVKEIENGLNRMNITLNHEIDRLKILQEKNNNIRPEEIQIALKEQAELTSLIKNAHVRMDAIQLIRKE